jgi:putative endonuclease
MELNRRKSYTYMMTNKNNSVIYAGVTTNLAKRVWQHKNRAFGGFTARYNCHKLVYYESYDQVVAAIKREKQLKAGSRRRKDLLIHQFNPEWKDLSDGWAF